MQIHAKTCPTPSSLNPNFSTLRKPQEGSSTVMLLIMLWFMPATPKPCLLGPVLEIKQQAAGALTLAA